MKPEREKSELTVSFNEQTLPIIEQISEGMPGGFLFITRTGTRS